MVQRYRLEDPTFDKDFAHMVPDPEGYYVAHHDFVRLRDEGVEDQEQQCPGCRGLKQISGVDCALCEGAGTVWVEVPV